MLLSNTSSYEMELELRYDSNTFQSPTIEGWLCVLHNAIAILLLWVGFRVQKAVFKVFKKLGSRYINTIIYPTVVLISIIFPPLVICCIIRSLYYPMSEIFGSHFCYIFNFVQTWGGMTMQFHSLFLASFRYICLFHDDKLIKYDITPKSLARRIVILHVLLPTFMTFFIIHGTVPSITYNTCHGQYHLNIGRQGNQFCTEGSLLTKILCHSSFALYFFMSSNIFDAFLLFPCFKKIQAQNEKTKSMLGEKTYVIRRKDIGIVLKISVMQWRLEMAQLIIYLLYVYYAHGYSSNLDKFFTLYVLAFISIVQPAFYLNGDVEFRAKLDKDGLFSAMKDVLFL